MVWKADQESWARLHEEAFRTFGGSVAYVVLDNLKQGVLEPDLYAPLYNPLYAAMLAHYGAVADAARVVDPDRKGTVENAIQHTQSTALKGRKFDSIEEQNTWLAHWEERWAAPRIHGRKKRQVLAMFAEEKPALKALPATRFRYFRETSHTVDDSGLVQVLRSYYAAIPASPGDIVTVRLYEHDVEIIDSCRPTAAPPSAFDETRALRDAGVGSDLQSLARNRAITRQGRQARAEQPATRPRHLPALGPARAKGALRHVELTAPLCEGGHRERREARTHLEPAVLSRPQVASSSATPPRPSAARPCPSCNRPARTSATSRNTTPSSRTHNTDLMWRIGISNARPVQGCPQPCCAYPAVVASKSRGRAACLGYSGHQ